jgi:hypothetical protein
MGGDEIVAENANGFQEKLASAICRHPGLPKPAITRKENTHRIG